MRQRFMCLTRLALVGAGVAFACASASAQAPGKGPRTPWGDPDLQGIWSDEFQTPLERPAQYANREFFTEEERATLDRERQEADHFGDRTQPRGTEADVAGAYNAVFTSQRHVGRRTSLIVDPPDGRMPALTPAVRKRNAETREFQQALARSTNACRDNVPGACGGGAYGPPSPLRDQQPTHYSVANLNRADNPEDRSLGERCMSGNLPEYAGGFVGIYRRIVQGPGVVYIYYDSGQGQGWSRTIPITDAPHLPSHVRQWWGDSRGHWEGDTLVVDVTNFNGKREFQGSRENLHLVERWTRIGADTLELVATMEDPTAWARPWTVKVEFNMQSNQANRIYTEPRCHEGNYGLVGLLAGARAIDTAFAEGRGPHPATVCVAACGNFDEDTEPDPLGSTARIKRR